MRRRLLVLLLATVGAGGACGGGSGGADARNDAVTFADAPLTGTCDYTEHDDVDNAATAETTALTVGGAPRTICGAIDRGHLSGDVVDDDVYAIAVAAGGADLVVRLDGAGAAYLTEVLVEIQDAAGNGHGYGVYVVDHGVMTTHLAAGTYSVVVEARHVAEIETTVPYHVTIAADVPSMHCPKITAAANHVEADDGKDFAANDMIYIVGGAETLTPSATDAPDDTGLVVTSEMSYRITGSSAKVDVAPPDGDDYNDRDTFLISTGADTNELDLRLDWTGATNDLDFFLFPEVVGNTTPLDIGGGATSTFGEVQTIAVAPSSRYWLWVGGFDSSKALPTTYDVSICGTHHGAR
jgi:hypothetical protein